MENNYIELIKNIRKKYGFSISECIKIIKNKKIKNYNNNYKNNNKNIIISSLSKDKKYGFFLKIYSNTDFTLKSNEIMIFINKIKKYILNNKFKNINNNININKYIKYLSIIFKENIYIDNFDYLCGQSIFEYNHINKYSVIISTNLLNNSEKVNIIKNISIHIISNYNEYNILYNKKNILNNQKYILDSNIKIIDLLNKYNIKIFDFKILNN